MTQIKNKADQLWKKRLFFASVLTTAREMPKTEGKIPGKIVS